MELYERIKYLRKDILNLSQEKFGLELGANRDIINNIERNRLKNPEQKEPIYQLICSKFKVNEKWLRSGEGEIFRRNPIKDEIGYYIEDLLDDYGDNPFYDMVLDLVKTYSELDEKSKAVIRYSAKKFKENVEARASKSALASQDT